MLETIREFGLEQLAKADERDAIRNHHAAWCAELASQSDAGLNSPEQSVWLARLQQEHENFRAALDWTIEVGESELALLLSGSLLRFWVSIGHFAEARRWYEQALALDPEAETTARAKALLGIEVIAYFQGDYAAAQGYGEEGLRIYQALEDTAGTGWSYGNLGLIADAEEDYARATELYTRALAIFRELGDETHTHFMLGNLGLIAHFQGDQERAAALLEESLTLSRELGNQNSVSINLSNLGLVAFARTDLDRAFELQTEALKLRVETGNHAGLARSYDNFAVIAAARKDYARAARLFGMADGLRTELGTALQPNDAEFNRPYIERAQQSLGQQRFIALWGEGAAALADDAIHYALNPSSALQTADAPGVTHQT
jgi:non-specific serine/threonine protein kinase